MQKNLHTKNKSRTFALELRKQHRGVEQLVARWAHNPKVVCSSQASATTNEISRCGAVSSSLTPKPKCRLFDLGLRNYERNIRFLFFYVVI